MNLLTHSRMATNRLCQRKHDLMYNQGFRPVVISDALRFGTLMHKGLEAFWKGEVADLSGESDPFELAKAEELLRGYAQMYDRNDYEVLAVEAQFDAPLLNPETMQPSRTFRLAGKIDVIVKKDGRVSVMEHKTTSSIDEDYWAKLQMDSQISIYQLGAESLGYEVSDCIYDVIQKPGIRPLKATPIESRRITKAGVLDARQREADETPEEYRVRLRETITHDYFQQRLIPRMNSQLRDSMMDFWQAARQIRETKYSPRNPDSCFQYNTRCPFWACCATGLDPAEHPELFTRSTPNPELQ